MKRLIVNSIILTTTVLVLFVGLAFLCSRVPLWHNETKAFYSTRSFILQEPEQYEVLIAGSSKGMLFTENTMNDSLEIILDANATNISKIGAGVLPMNVMLKYFYATGNETRHIIRFVDTQDFYSSYSNEYNDFLDTEPLNPTLARIAWEEDIAPKMFAKYIQSKFRWEWLHLDNIRPDKLYVKQLPEVDTTRIRKRLEVLYPQGTDQENFERYSNHFYRFIETAQAHNSKVTFVMLPHKLGPLPGHQQVIDLLENIKLKYGIEYYDYSADLNELKYFTDHDHLNALGVAYVLRNHLKPIVEKEKTP